MPFMVSAESQPRFSASSTALISMSQAQTALAANKGSSQ
jgi:hypothetical protein